MERFRLGLFDVDGTVKTKDMPPEIERGFRNLWDNEQMLTTVITGRGFIRLREMLGDKWQNIISQGLPVALENGARITTQKGDNIRYYPLKQSEIVSTLQIVDNSRDEVLFVGYFPESVKEKPILWTPNNKTAEKFQKQYGYFADITTTSLSNFEEQMRQDNPCMVMIRPRSMELKNEFQGSNVVFNEGEFNLMTSGRDKGKGAEDISSILDIPVSNFMIAGNDENDMPMLNLPVGLKIVVGDSIKSKFPSEKNIVFVPNPEELGNYLSVWRQNHA